MRILSPQETTGEAEGEFHGPVVDNNVFVLRRESGESTSNGAT